MATAHPSALEPTKKCVVQQVALFIFPTLFTHFECNFAVTYSYTYFIICANTERVRVRARSVVPTYIVRIYKISELPAGNL